MQLNFRKCIACAAVRSWNRCLRLAYMALDSRARYGLRATPATHSRSLSEPLRGLANLWKLRRSSDRISPSLCADGCGHGRDHPTNCSRISAKLQGVILVFKSADNVRVVRANTQSRGRCGGDANCRSCSGMSSLDIACVTGTCRDRLRALLRVSIQQLISHCGLTAKPYLLVSGRGVQNCRSRSSTRALHHFPVMVQ